MHYRFNRPRLSSSSRATRHVPRATRRGFTLVELMVAMALTMFIMVILSEAFATGLDVFSQLKAIGDMEESLRAASTALRNDLAADHFIGKRRLSDPDSSGFRPRSLSRSKKKILPFADPSAMCPSQFLDEPRIHVWHQNAPA